MQSFAITFNSLLHEGLNYPMVKMRRKDGVGGQTVKDRGRKEKQTKSVCGGAGGDLKQLHFCGKKIRVSRPEKL